MTAYYGLVLDRLTVEELLVWIAIVEASGGSIGPPHRPLTTTMLDEELGTRGAPREQRA